MSEIKLSYLMGVEGRSLFKIIHITKANAYVTANHPMTYY